MRGMIFCKRCGSYTADGVDACPKCGASFAEFGHPTLAGGLFQTRGSPAKSFGPDFEPAGHVQRFVAYLIDVLLVGLILLVGYFAFLWIPLTAGVLRFLAVASALAYEPYFIASNGATPGKSAMDLRVVGRDGGQIDARKSVLRYVLKYILGSVLWLVGLFTARRRCLHDLIAGTYVVRA